VKLVRTIGEMRAVRAPLDAPFGFVPTMGALHEGHLSLVRLAREGCPRVGASVFVNPTQFNDKRDLARYPRTLERDMEMLRTAGCDVVFAPEPGEIYPEGFSTTIDVGPVTRPLEGAMRPGHFNGVAVVVTKLLNIVRPTHAVFGQKDAQQLAVIRRMVRDLDLAVEILAGPTMREADGLAMSSRNALLTTEDRAAAPVLCRALNAARQAYAAGEREGAVLRVGMTTMIAAEARAVQEYVSVADPVSLEEIARVGNAGALVSLAVRFGAVRLIDNVVLPPS
jgi:pantoate--beta-alanine ligase